MKYYCEDAQRVLEAFNTQEGGLQTREAEERLRRDGANKLPEEKKTPLFRRFLKQITDPMTLVLIAAAIVSAVTAVIGGESFADVIIIMAVVIINATLGVVQESKAEQAIEALKSMSATMSKVYRDGSLVHVKSEDLVRGDIVLLEAGDSVPADGRLIECASLKVEESALTGESEPVSKQVEAIALGDRRDVSLGDRKNMVYMGTTVVYGRARVVITDTGIATEMGKIANALTQTKEGLTPLQRKLKQLSAILSKLVIGICLFIFAFSLIRGGSFEGRVILNTFMIAVSLAVAAIPEGLSTVVTIVLSIGVTNMSRRNAIIRRLTCVETLGCAQIICSDKTGTLTQNRMTVVERRSPDETLLLTAMALCSDAVNSPDGQVTGEPTECALVADAKRGGVIKEQAEARTPRVGEAPFDSVRKMMTTLHADGVRVIQYTKGAPDEVLARCVYGLRDGQVKMLTDADRTEIMNNNKNMADRALRVLAAATRDYNAMPSDLSPQALERDMVFIGLCGMIDPIRPEVLDAVARCRDAGMRAVMITGDHRDTAVAIAMELGIITDPAQAITGAQLDEIPDDVFERDVEKYGVYARVQPENKVRIVNAWRKKGYITAMTGDGVNDAPSLKNADIGVGMGITGTDVTKNVADMVLADDNFATIVGAVEEGRRIYDNIRKAIQYLLASNLSEVLAIFAATLIGFTILKPVHLLWINLITDCLPALSLGMEKSASGVMRRRPRPANEGVFADGLGVDVTYQGIMVMVLTLASYMLGHAMEFGNWMIGDSALGMTMAFITMSAAEVFHAFNVRSQHESIFTIRTQNMWLWGAGVFSFLLTLAVLFVPFLRDAFSFSVITLPQFAIAFGIAAMVLPIVEAVKAIQRAIHKKRA